MEACLFCDSDKESSALEPNQMFICTRCRVLLEAQDDIKLQVAYEFSIQKGKWRKAMALKMVLDDRRL
jgi:hypothetical protein